MLTFIQILAIFFAICFFIQSLADKECKMRIVSASSATVLLVIVIATEFLFK